MFVFLFSVELRWLPTSGSGGASYWVLPVATLVLRPFGILVQIVRGAVIVALAASFIKTAKAKGAQRVRVLFVHALPNALLPIVTVVGDLAAQLAGGVTVIETVFGWPGIGKLMIDAILQRDFPVMQAGILAVATVIVLINITVEVLYPIIDPRVRTS
jgi:peptide/nickel transport system permease protein